MAATLGPNDNCQLWPEWQVPMCGAILIQTGNCQTGLRLAAALLGPVVAPNPVSHCAIARMATTGNCQSGARVAKICCVYPIIDALIHLLHNDGWTRFLIVSTPAGILGQVSLWSKSTRSNNVCKYTSTCALYLTVGVRFIFWII